MSSMRARSYASTAVRSGARPVTSRWSGFLLWGRHGRGSFRGESVEKTRSSPMERDTKSTGRIRLRICSVRRKVFSR
jgi:hypothetical protein